MVVHFDPIKKNLPPPLIVFVIASTGLGWLGVTQLHWTLVFNVSLTDFGISNAFLGRDQLCLTCNPWIWAKEDNTLHSTNWAQFYSVSLDPSNFPYPHHHRYTLTFVKTIGLGWPGVSQQRWTWVFNVYCSFTGFGVSNILPWPGSFVLDL